jgi:hypothetical protein
MNGARALLAAATVLIPVAGRPAPSEGTGPAVLARLPFGARGLALGGDHGLVPGAASSLLSNPAAIAGEAAANLETGWHQGVSDVRYGGVAGRVRLLPWLSAGGAVETMTAGALETWDAAGNVRYTADLQEDRLFTAGAAARAGPLALGGTLKIFHSTIAGARAAAAVMGDVGAKARIELPRPDDWDRRRMEEPSPSWIDVGLAVSQLGETVAYGGEADPPPTVWRAGAAFGHVLGRDGRVLLAAALDVPQWIARPEARVGVEAARRFGGVAFAFRVGGRFRRDSGALTAGAGTAWRGIGLDYAFLGPRAPFGGTHHVSASLDLGELVRVARDD